MEEPPDEENGKKPEDTARGHSREEPDVEDPDAEDPDAEDATVPNDRGENRLLLLKKLKTVPESSLIEMKRFILLKILKTIWKS